MSRATTAKQHLLAIALAVIAGMCIGCLNPKGQNERSLAHDSKTGEYIGIVVSECTDWQTKKPTSYKIRLKDGRVIERPPDSITIDRP